MKRFSTGAWLRAVLASSAALMACFQATPQAAAQSTGTSVSITEIMPLPDNADPVAGQWVELTNLTDKAINVQGLGLVSNSLGGFHAISPLDELILEPGAVLLLGASSEPTLNGGAPVVIDYGDDLPLNPQKDIVFLMKGSSVVDSIVYGLGDVMVEKGFSISREPGDASPPNWCWARKPFGSGDYGTPGIANGYCDDDLDTYSEDEGDCDDTNSVIRPGGLEACNGLDENCNGVTDENVVPPPGICPSKGVCAAIVPVCEGLAGYSCPAVPGWEPDGETLCDGLDNDCDGLTDELLRFNGTPVGMACVSPGECGQGTVVCSPVTARPTCSTMPDGTEPGSRSETCDGLDNDCDALTDEGFGVGGACSAGLGTCARTGVVVCGQDGRAECNAVPGPPGTELCGDRRDNDCDGFTDEGFEVGSPCTVGTGACMSYSKFVCRADMLGVVCPAIELDPSDEICGDLVDNDCNGDTDEYGCVRRSDGCSASRGNADWFPRLAPLLLFILAFGTASTTRRRSKP